MFAHEFIREMGIYSSNQSCSGIAHTLIRTLVNDCDYEVPTAVPAKILKVNKGVLATGYDADIVVFDQEINISYIFIVGRKIM